MEEVFKFYIKVLQHNDKLIIYNFYMEVLEKNYEIIKNNIVTMESKSYKKCNKCGKYLPIDLFNKRKDTKDGFTYYCKNCLGVKSKNWYNDNKEIRKKINKNYYEENKQILAEKKKQYYKNNRDKYNQYKKRYRENTYKTLRHLTLNDWKKIKKCFNYECCYCGEKTELHKDHLIPVSKGGDTIIGNIVPTCRRCNASKKDKDFLEWYKNYEHYNSYREQKILDFLQNENIKNKLEQIGMLLEGENYEYNK